MNYTTLQADVASWIHRTDLTTPIPKFIDQARLRIGRELRGLCNFTTGTVTSFASELTALPTNLAALAGVMDSDGLPLEEVSVGEAGIGYTGGVYAVAGSDLWVPGAGATDVVTLTYWTIPAALSSGTDVSEGMNELPDLWRYASVAEAARYTQDWELADRMDAAYIEALRGANNACSRARFVAPSVQNYGIWPGCTGPGL